MSIFIHHSFIEKTEKPKIDQLIEYLLLNPSAFIDPKKLIRIFGINHSKLEKLFLELEQNKIGLRVYPFTHQYLNISLINHFKFYFFNYRDHALNKNIKLRQDQEGAAIEQYFYSEIYKNSNIFISTFRTKNNLEVDFILTLPDKTLMAIELKKDQFIYAADLQGLHFFDKQLPVNKKLFVFHSGTRENDEGKIAIMPIDKGISIIHQL